jgi:hypothetical protein
VSRSRVHGSGKAAKVPAGELLDQILGDILATATMPYEEWHKLWPDPFTAMAIPVGGRRQYQCTQRAIDAAHTLTQQTWDARDDLRQTMTRQAFDRVSFTAIGDAVATCRRHLPPEKSTGPVDDSFFDAMAGDYESYLEAGSAKIRPDLDRHISCHLFDANQAVPAFDVGPVAFRPRGDWIARYVLDPRVLSHVQQVESGAVSLETFRNLAFAAGSAPELTQALEVLTFLGGYGWVATLRTVEHELTRSHEKASVIVGLAIDVIGLRFHLENARLLTKAGRQHLFHESRLATSLAGQLLKGSSSQRAGLGAAPGALAAKMRAEQSFLDQSGKVLQAYVDGRNTGKAPHLIERWANALYWFGEARRESSDFMAVVNYGCAADGLLGAGGKAEKMIDFAEAALNPKSEPTPAGVVSVKDAVSQVYREGRNKLAHGEESGLFEDLTRTRAIGDNLLTLLLNEVTPEIAEIIANRPQVLTVPEEHAYRALVVRLQSRV